MSAIIPIISGASLAAYLASMIIWSRARTDGIKRRTVAFAALALITNVAAAAYSVAMASPI
jgi:hypothetical protein